MYTASFRYGSSGALSLRNNWSQTCHKWDTSCIFPLMAKHPLVSWCKTVCSPWHYFCNNFSLQIRSQGEVHCWLCTSDVDKQLFIISMCMPTLACPRYMHICFWDYLCSSYKCNKDGFGRPCLSYWRITSGQYVYMLFPTFKILTVGGI